MDTDVVLVVDDDPDCREVICAVLEMLLKVQTVTAQDGEEALRLAQCIKPALVVLDVMLPRLSGFDVAKRLKSDADTQAIPVVALTALYTAAAQAIAAGCDDCVEKPFELERLAGTVQNYLPNRNPTSRAA
jgi:CheY-like chemotaxis protein